MRGRQLAHRAPRTQLLLGGPRVQGLGPEAPPPPPLQLPLGGRRTERGALRTQLLLGEELHGPPCTPWLQSHYMRCRGQCGAQVSQGLR